MVALADIEKTVAGLNIVNMINVGDIRLLYRLAASIPAGGKILEIGTNKGRSTRVLCAAAPECSVITIDWYNHWEGKQPENLTRIIDYSENVSKLSLVCGDMYDLIYIDGGHSEDDVATDIKCWLPRLKYGGYIVFHDYGHGAEPGVNAAVNKHISIHPELKRIMPFEDEIKTCCYISQRISKGEDK